LPLAFQKRRLKTGNQNTDPEFRFLALRFQSLYHTPPTFDSLKWRNAAVIFEKLPLAWRSADSAPPENGEHKSCFFSAASAIASRHPYPGPPDFAGGFALLLRGWRRLGGDPCQHGPE
jgi:hypothetical protein